MKVDRPIKQRRRQTPIKIRELSGASLTGRRVARSVGAEFDTAPWTLTKKHRSFAPFCELWHPAAGPDCDPANRLAGRRRARNRGCDIRSLLEADRAWATSIGRFATNLDCQASGPGLTSQT